MNKLYLTPLTMEYLLDNIGSLLRLSTCSYYAIGQIQNETVKFFIIPDIITGTRSGHVLPILLPHVGASTCRQLGPHASPKHLPYNTSTPTDIIDDFLL